MKISFLWRSASAWRILLLSVAVGSGASMFARGHQVPLFVRATHETQQGFVRIINRSNQAGDVRVTAIDDEGMTFDAFTLSMAAWETQHFNSNHLENGDADRGISGVGRGTGNWRLVLDSDLNLEVLAYVRTRDGFLTAMHDTVPKPAETHLVPIFNPGSNRRQVSKLRIINPSDDAAAVVVSGVDDAGQRAPAVRLTVPALAARTFTALDLERGHGQLEGSLGDGVGKWSLFITSEQDIAAMSLLESGTGHLTNLSSTTARADRPIPEQSSPTYVDVFALDGEQEEPAGIAYATERLYVVDDGIHVIDRTVRKGRVFAYTLGGAAQQSEYLVLDEYPVSTGALTYGRDRLLLQLPTFNVLEVRAYTTAGERDVAGGFRHDILAVGIAHAGDRVYAIDYEVNGDSQEVYAFTPSGRRVDDWSFDLDNENRDSTAAVHADGRLYLVDAADYKVYAYLLDGQRDEAADFPLDGGNNDPVGIAYAPTNRSFYVLDGATLRVFRYAVN